MKGFRWMAFCVLFVVVGWAAMPFAYWLTLVCALGAVVMIGAYGREAFFSSDRYSLSSLREFEDKEAARQLAAEMDKLPTDADSIVCSRCLEPYPGGLPCCPRCKSCG